MKKIHDINFGSRTVWTGIFSIIFGIAGFFIPDLPISQSPDLLISVGFGLVFLKS